MELNKDNYYTTEANKDYMSFSQFRVFFSDCRAKALAEIKGEYVEEPTDAMLQGAYIDAYVEGRLEEFIKEHPEMISSRGPTKGQLKSQFKFCDVMIERMERDALFRSFLEGEKQVILTGEIAGVPFKGKLDILGNGRIVDFKTARDFNSVWSQSKGARVNFIDAWDYDLQGAIYQELYRQQTGKVLPFYIAAVTKESEPDIATIEVPNEILASALDRVSYYAPTFQLIKEGQLPAERCERCDYCKRTKVLTEPLNYYSLEDIYF